MGNALFYGDNLGYLREMDRDCVDLVYLDPPFNSKANYNLLFRSPQGGSVQAQTTAFVDTWRWDMPAEMAFDDVLTSGSPAAGMLKALRAFLGESDLMAYLAMMTPRLIELRRVLKPHGTLYLHCDTHAAHYLKVVLDGIFGANAFVNEISWRRAAGKSDHAQGATHFPRLRDVILRYSRDPAMKPTYHQPFTPYGQAYAAAKYPFTDPDGRRFGLWDMTGPGGAAKGNPRYEVMGVARHWRYSRDRMESLLAEGRVVQPSPGAVPRYKRYLDEMPGVPVGDDWGDISPINSQAQERLGYPTQKPLPLLKRLIEASSNPGDVVLDPFCGCGTTVEAADALGRRWIGIDITHHAIDVIEGRLKAANPAASYRVTGRPLDLESAERLAARDPYEFQWWANWMIGVQNYRERKKGADKGIDGIIYFHNPPHGVGQTIVSVKAGKHVDPSMIDALAGTVKREDAQFGVFVCLTKPTDGMRQRAAGQGIQHVGREAFGKIQIITAAELLAGGQPRLPRPVETAAFQQKLRPARPAKAAPPQPQLSLALPILGGKAKRPDVQDHLSGQVIGELASVG